MGLIVGFMAGVGVRVTWLGGILNKEERDRIIGLTLILIGLSAVAQNVLFQKHQRAVANCQTTYNSSFQVTLRERSKIADEDRSNLVTLITTVTNSKSRDVSRKALEDYISINARLDAERKTFKYPPLPRRNCK